MDSDIMVHTQAETSRYLGVAGLVFLFYDHSLSFADEVEYIWKARWSVPKVLFLLVRYIVPCVLVLHTYELTGMKRDEMVDTNFRYMQFCRAWFNLSVILGSFSMGAGNFLVLLRLWILWDRNRRLIMYTLPLFALAQIAVFACAVVVLVRVTPTLLFDQHLGLCSIQERSVLAALFTPPVMFDGLALLCILWHSLRRPRNCQGVIVQKLDQNRFVYIFLLFVLRLLNLGITLFAPIHIVFLSLCFIWAVTTVTISRLILDLRKNVNPEKDSTCHSQLESVCICD